MNRYIQIGLPIITLLLLSLIFGALIIGACSSSEESSAQVGPRVLKVMTHDSFDLSEGVLETFQETNDVEVQFIKSGDTGTALNKTILSRQNPVADVFYGVDNTFLSRALKEGIFESYSSPMLEKIDPIYQLDPQNRALPVDTGDVCLNYDVRYFETNNLQPPQSLDDLLKPEYKGLLVVQNPATSSPGLSFLLATIGNYSPDGYLEYWSGLVENDVLVVNDWESAYYSEFSGSSGMGTRPIVVSYNSSPAFEVIFAETPSDSPPTAAVVTNESCFRQVEFVGILLGTPNRDLAELWIDFMLSTTFQEDMPLKMFVFPVNREAVLDPEFEEYLEIPITTAFVSPEDIATQREEWLRAWTETVLR